MYQSEVQVLVRRRPVDICVFFLTQIQAPSRSCLWIINNYWTRLSKISWFVSVSQINYLPQPSAWSAHHRQITIFCDNRVQELFYHWIPKFVLLMNILGRWSDLPFSRKSDSKKEKSTVSFTHVQNIICSQTQLEGIVHEQIIICRQLFAGHVVGFGPMKRKKNLLRMIILFYLRLRLTLHKWVFIVSD